MAEPGAPVFCCSGVPIRFPPVLPEYINCESLQQMLSWPFYFSCTKQAVPCSIVNAKIKGNNCPPVL